MARRQGDSDQTVQFECLAIFLRSSMRWRGKCTQESRLCWLRLEG